MTEEPFNIDEVPLNRDWLHSKWNMPAYRSKEFFQELKELRMTLAEFKETAMYKRAVDEGVIVNDEWNRG